MSNRQLIQDFLKKYLAKQDIVKMFHSNVFNSRLFISEDSRVRISYEHPKCFFEYKKHKVEITFDDYNELLNYVKQRVLEIHNKKGILSDSRYIELLKELNTQLFVITHDDICISNELLELLKNEK